MNGQAALSTGLVHLLGAILTLMPLGHRPPSGRIAGAEYLMSIDVQAPALALVAESGLPGSADGVGPFLSEGRGCPDSPPVDSDAEPAFPLLGAARPFQHLPRARWSPVFCARIGRNGRILELRAVGAGSGNPAADRGTARELSRLRFRPACRGGQPTEAWHRILVYLPDTALPAVTDNPTPLPSPSEELMIPMPVL